MFLLILIFDSANLSEKLTHDTALKGIRVVIKLWREHDREWFLGFNITMTEILHSILPWVKQHVIEQFGLC